MKENCEIIYKNLDKKEKYESTIQGVVDACFKKEHLDTTNLYLSVTLTNAEEIEKLNMQYRNIDRPTDVLSFPMLEYETPGDLNGIEESADAFNPETGELMLGDIVISKESVISQAEKYGHSVKREYAFLIAHSMLHLLGYEHMEDGERMGMEKRQREIMEKAGIPR